MLSHCGSDFSPTKGAQLASDAIACNREPTNTDGSNKIEAFISHVKAVRRNCLTLPFKSYWPKLRSCVHQLQGVLGNVVFYWTYVHPAKNMGSVPKEKRENVSWNVKLAALLHWCFSLGFSVWASDFVFLSTHSGGMNFESILNTHSRGMNLGSERLEVHSGESVSWSQLGDLGLEAYFKGFSSISESADSLVESVYRFPFFGLPFRGSSVWGCSD